MKNAARFLVVLLGVCLMLSSVGCPKKQVIEPEPEPMPEPMPEPEPEPEPYQFNLGMIHFDFDKSDIRMKDAKILEGNGKQLMDAAASEAMEKPMVSIEGHCDPIGTAEYNMALGQRRADAAKAFLVKLGVPASQLTTMSYGEEKLVTNNADEYEQNRRCEFMLGK